MLRPTSIVYGDEKRLSVSLEIWDRDRFVAGIPAECPDEVRWA